MPNLVKHKIDLTEKIALDIKNQAEELNKELLELHSSIRVDSVSVCHLFSGVQYVLWIQGIGYPNTIPFESYQFEPYPKLSIWVEVQLINLIWKSNV